MKKLTFLVESFIFNKEDKHGSDDQFMIGLFNLKAYLGSGKYYFTFFPQS
jgi:hypothetical protein